MPPKPAAKKGKDDQEDFSDVPSLPPLNSVNFSMYYHRFQSAEVREKLQKYVTEHWPQERVKTLTREDIIAYGKAKLIIVDATTVPPIPQDDPRLKMSTEDQIAKAASDRLFELQVHARRAKKEKIAKLEEEAKASGNIDQTGAPIVGLDPDQLDTMFQFLDYPKSKAEAFSFAKYNNTLNFLISINQLNAREEDDYEPGEGSYDQQTDYHVDKVEAIGYYVPDDVIDQSEIAHRQTIRSRLDELQYARSNSVKTSVLRFQAPVYLEYKNLPLVSEIANNIGEIITERKEPEQVFFEVLMSRLEHFGALYIKYLRFRDKVQVTPLHFDQAALQELNAIDALKNEYAAWWESAEPQWNIVQADETSLERAELAEQKNQWLQSIEQANAQVDDLRKRAKVSVDDTKDLSNFRLDTYKKDIAQSKESQNQIAGIMSAMITQLSIDAKNNGDQNDSFDQLQDNSTEESLINDMLSSWSEEVGYKLGLNEAPNNTVDYKERDASYLLAPPQATKGFGRQGTRALAKASTAVGEIEYQEELDFARKSITILPKESTSSEEEKAEDVYLREKNIVKNLLIPGQDRYLMPDVPSKSQRLRDAEKPAIYPFSTLPVDDQERAQVMRAFQELIKSNFIDEGISPEQRLSKYKIFERNYQSHMSSEILSQVLADAMLQDPEIATSYFPRDDKLLVALYNKATLNKSEDQILDGERDWTAANRVLPDFLHFLTSFADQVVVTQQLTQQQKTADQQQTAAMTSQAVKYQLDEEMIPNSLLDIDDGCVQNISETSQFFYPDDNSIMRVDTVQIAGQVMKKAVVIKDNLTFGIRKTNQSQYDAPEEEKEHGLVSYHVTSPTEFWVQFENQTKMIVETVKYDRNPQKLIRIDPPKPTAEEIAAREEAVKAAQVAAAKNKGKAQQANVPIIEEYKEPEPTWEPEPFNFLDELFNDEMIEQSSGPMLTTTLPNGLIVRHLTNGDVCQTTEDQILSDEDIEKDRVIIGKGVVIRHLRNKDTEVLFPRGEKAYFQRDSMLWIVTNNKGMRQAKKDGKSWDLSPIPCAIEKDAVSEARMLIREDNVVAIQYKDGSSYCQHEDGTQMKINAEKTEIRVEKEGFAPVVIQISEPHTQLQQWQQSSNHALQRTYDGLVTKTLLPDGTIVEGYADLDEAGGKPNYKYYYKRTDYSVIYVDKKGSIAVVTSNTRSAMNENGGKTKIGQDTDYLREIQYSVQGASSGQISPCIYCVSIDPDTCQPTISTVGASGRYYYEIDSAFQMNKVLRDGHNEERRATENDQSIQQVSKNNEGRDLEDVGGPKNPFDKHFNYPRFFVVSPDGSGYELMSKEQLEYYFRVRKNNPTSLKQRKIVMVGATSAKSHYFVTKVKSLAECEQELQIIQNLEFPQNALYAIQRIKKQNQRNQGKAHTQTRPDQYLFRQIFEFQEFEIFKQDAYYEDLSRFKQWKQNQTRYDSEFGMVHVPPKDGQLDYKKIEDDDYLSKRINLKILKERRNKRPEFQPEEFKAAFIRQMQQSDEVTEYHRRMTQYDRSDSFRVTSAGFNQGDIGSEHHTQANFQVDVYAANENWRAKKKSQDQARLAKFMHDIHTMINTPTFLPNYFKSYDGQMFTKNNPEKPPSQELLMRMAHRMNRSQQNSEKAQSNYDGYSQKSGNHSPAARNMGSDDLLRQEQEDKDNPIVALEPEEHHKQGSAYMRSKISKQNEEEAMPAFSLYQQEKQYLKQRETEGVLKAEEYHVIKTKDFNVYGRLRQDRPFVKATQKSQAQSDLNEKFITTECIADRRVKISSMAPRQYINAPSVEQVRKQGQHQIIDQAIENKWTFPQVINKVNSMVTSVLHDSLKRSFNVLPAKCVFGKVKAGKTYELIVTVKNEDSLSQRINVVAPGDKRISVQQEEQGPIAPGLLRKIIVTLRSDENDSGIIKDTLQIKAKTDIFSIPIEAQIMSQEEFEEANRESQAIRGAPVTNSRVKERLNDSIRKSQQTGMRTNQDMDDLRREEDNKGWIQTTGSESKLPHLPPIDERPFQIDPKRPLKDILKKQ